MTNTLPRIALTPGEPAGIGPDIIIALAQHAHLAELCVFADPDLMRSRAQQLSLPLHITEVDLLQPPVLHTPGSLKILPIPLVSATTPGQLNPKNANYVLETLRQATLACVAGHCQALVTGPIHKGVINDAGVPFTGHTEFLAAETRTDQVVMMLAAPGIRVALATTHLPLAEVSEAITADLLEDVLTILHHDLRQRFGIANPHILVCGLNPHAGEGGHLGREEIEVIEPVLARLREQGMRLTGPVPADTAFTPQRLKQVDAHLAMYHDQGLPVLKHLGFGQAINITLGLPILRTSVDHGTALELAGTGRADTGSLEAALQAAIQLSGVHTP